MKKLLTYFIFILSMVICFSTNVKTKAVHESVDSFSFVLSTASLVSSETIYLTDGSYIVNEVYENVSNTGYGVSLFSTAFTYVITGTKIITKYDSSDSIQWQFILYADFSINPGISSTCINASYSQNIFNTKWSFSGGSTSFSNNYAYAKGTYKYKLIIVLQTVNIDTSLGYDYNGNKL